MSLILSIQDQTTLNRVFNNVITYFGYPDWALSKPLGDLLAEISGSSGSVTSITAGAGLTGGVITTTGTIAMPNVGPGAGTYGGSGGFIESVTLDVQGRIAALTTLMPVGTISGTIDINQIAFGSALDTIAGSNDLSWDGSFLNIIGNISLLSSQDIRFNGMADLNWRIGINTGGFVHSILNSANSLDIVVGGGPAPDGLAIGSSGGNSILEADGNTGKIWIRNPLTDAGQSNSIDTAGRTLLNGVSTVLNWSSLSLTGGNWSATGNFTSTGILGGSNFSGSSSGVNTGDQSLSTLPDVNLSAPSTGDFLGFNGIKWVNKEVTVANAPGNTTLFLDTVISTGGNGTLDVTPSIAPEVTIPVTVLNNTLLIGRYINPAAIGGGFIDGGNWVFDIFCKVDSPTDTSTIVVTTSKRVIQTGTVTITGVGTSRTATVSGSTPFVPGDANADLTLATWLETPLGTFQISGYTSSSVVTIVTTVGYVNESTVSFSLHYLLFFVSTDSIENTVVGTFNPQLVEPAFPISGTDQLSIAYYARTNSLINKTITLYLLGQAHASHVHTPLLVRHNDLPGLQGGSTNQYYHLTQPQAVVVSNTSGINTGNVTLSGENYLSILGQVITANPLNLSGTNATGILSAGRFPALTGDVTTVAGNLSTTLSLTGVSANSYGSVSNVGTFTVDSKGRISSASDVSIQIAESQVTNLISDLASKLSTALTSAHLFVGNVGNIATDIALSGDATLTNAGVLTISNQAVTYAKIQDVSTNKLLGRSTAGSGIIEEISVGSGLSLAGGTLSASGGGTVTNVSVISANGLAGTVATATTTPAITLSTTITGLLKGNGTAILAAVAGTDYQSAGNYITALTGDVTAVGPGSVVATLANSGVIAATYGDANHVSQVAFDAKGRATAASNVLIAIDAGAITSGILPIVRGGTNSSAALNNNRVMQSSGGAIIEASAITAARALISDANGIPTQSVVTSTELGYVSGVTSAIQTQLNNKLSIIATSRTVTVSGAINSSDAAQYIYCNGAGAISLTFPAHVAGFTVTIKDISGNASSNNITLVRNGGAELFEGLAADKILQTNYGVFKIYDDGTNYWIVN